MSPIDVMHIIDTLDAGGAERVTVNLTNLLPRQHYRAHLCTTRREGLLANLVDSEVGRLRLERTKLVDRKALSRLVNYIREHKVKILHAHGSSLFMAGAASLFSPHPAVIWHTHFGRYALEDRRAILYKLAATRVKGIIAVNEALAEWARRRMNLPSERIWYIPNFVAEINGDKEMPVLPGEPGKRVVCVANLRPEKDHLTLLNALELVKTSVPDVHLLLVGAETDLPYVEVLKTEISKRHMGKNISLLGQRTDVAALLAACDIGVLSSATEGLPLALIEYGMAGLATVATHVGQCAAVLDNGKAGMLVGPGEPGQLAESLLSLLNSRERRRSFGNAFQHHVKEKYSAQSILEKVCSVYDSVLEPGLQ